MERKANSLQLAFVGNAVGAKRRHASAVGAKRRHASAKDAARLQFMEIVDISHTVFYTENDKRIKWVHGSNHTRV